MNGVPVPILSFLGMLSSIGKIFVSSIKNHLSIFLLSPFRMFAM